MLAERWGTELAAPESMIATMICARLPDAAGSTQEQTNRLRDALLFEERIEVPLHALAGGIWARVSAQIYNDIHDIERLASAVLARL